MLQQSSCAGGEEPAGSRWWPRTANSTPGSALSATDQAQLILLLMIFQHLMLFIECFSPNSVTFISTARGYGDVHVEAFVVGVIRNLILMQTCVCSLFTSKAFSLQNRSLDAFIKKLLHNHSTLAPDTRSPFQIWDEFIWGSSRFKRTFHIHHGVCETVNLLDGYGYCV